MGAKKTALSGTKVSGERGRFHYEEYDGDALPSGVCPAPVQEERKQREEEEEKLRAS